MPLTPADIHNVAFKRPPLGKRGYDEEEVDAFLDEVEQQLIRLLEENDDLRGRIGRPGSPAASSLEAEHSALTAQLQRAQQERARAEQHARSVQAQLESAPAERPAASSGLTTSSSGVSPVMMMAQRTADDHLADARREAEAMVVAAQDQSAQIAGEAQRSAGTTESEARRRHAEAINNLEIERTALLDEIERLRQLAESYQTALNEHVTAQLRYMEGVPEPVTGR
ncbi:DivIVA domain-containing protein [Actinoplanes sp. NPDC051633]|uniref:DivIVA domain-containing protein n=1 Tax=Actinoplanes sp. NPDC051633 TaxID=3155670 RepID=UPI00343E9F3C